MKKWSCYGVEDWLEARGLELLLSKWLSDQLYEEEGSVYSGHGERNKEKAGGRR